MEARGPRFWTGFGHDLRTFLKKCKKNVPPPVDPIQRVSGVGWRMDTNIDLLFISVWSSLKCKSTSTPWNCFEILMKSMNLVETCKVLCSNSFWIELVWWIAEEENCKCDGFFIFLVVEYWYCLTENTCSIHWNAFDSRSDARTWIYV